MIKWKHPEMLEEECLQRTSLLHNFLLDLGDQWDHLRSLETQRHIAISKPSPTAVECGSQFWRSKKALYPKDRKQKTHTVQEAKPKFHCSSFQRETQVGLKGLNRRLLILVPSNIFSANPLKSTCWLEFNLEFLLYKASLQFKVAEAKILAMTTLNGG